MVFVKTAISTKALKFLYGKLVDDIDVIFQLYWINQTRLAGEKWPFFLSFLHFNSKIIGGYNLSTALILDSLFEQTNGCNKLTREIVIPLCNGIHISIHKDSVVRQKNCKRGRFEPNLQGSGPFFKNFNEALPFFLLSPTKILTISQTILLH